MKYIYLLVYNSTIDPLQIREWVDNNAAIITWRSELPFSYYLVAETSADTLANDLRNFLGDVGRFLITEINENREGWLTQDSWYLLKYKHHPHHKKFRKVTQFYVKLRNFAKFIFTLH